MVIFHIGSHEVSIEGEGADDCPFLVTGTGLNPSVVALAEHHMMDHWMGEGNWIPTKTMTMNLSLLLRPGLSPGGYCLSSGGNEVSSKSSGTPSGYARPR